MPQHPDLNLDDGTITFTNEGVTIEAEVDLDFLQESLTVKSVAMENHGTAFDLPITDFVVPAPVVQHLLLEL